MNNKGTKENKPPGNKDDKNETLRLLIDDLSEVIQAGPEEKARLTEDLGETTRKIPFKMLQDLMRQIDEGIIKKPKSEEELQALLKRMEKEGLKPTEEQKARRQERGHLEIEEKSKEEAEAKMASAGGAGGIIPPTEVRLGKKLHEGPQQWDLKQVDQAIDQANLVREKLRAKDMPALKKILKEGNLALSPTASLLKLSAKEKARLMEGAALLFEKLQEDQANILVLDVMHGRPQVRALRATPLLERIAVNAEPGPKAFKEIRDVADKIVGVGETPEERPLDPEYHPKPLDLQLELMHEAAADFGKKEKNNLGIILRQLNDEERERIKTITDVAQIEQTSFGELSEEELEKSKKENEKFFFGDFLGRVQKKLDNKELTDLAKRFVDSLIDKANELAALHKMPKIPEAPGKKQK